MACHPVLLSSPAQGSDMFPSNEPHSPEKFLETSMVVKMAPCGGEGQDQGDEWGGGALSDMHLFI